MTCNPYFQAHLQHRIWTKHLPTSICTRPLQCSYQQYKPYTITGYNQAVNHGLWILCFCVHLYNIVPCVWNSLLISHWILNAQWHPKWLTAVVSAIMSVTSLLTSNHLSSCPHTYIHLKAHSANQNNTKHIAHVAHQPTNNLFLPWCFLISSIIGLCLS